MRCPSCDTLNEEGSAICVQCGEPLTAYAATLPAEANPRRTAARLAAASRQPPMAVVMACLDILAALLIVLTAVRVLNSTPSLNDDLLNYVNQAMGGLRTVLTLAFLIPLAVGLVVLAWGTIVQWSWTWPVHLLILAVLGVRFLWTFPRDPVGAVFGLGIVAVLAVFWGMPEVRQWYGQH